MPVTTRKWIAAVAGIVVLIAGFGCWKVTQIHTVIASTLPTHPDLSGWPPTFSDAIEAAEQKARSYTHPIQGTALLSRLYHANGFFNEASQCYSGLIKLEPNSAKWPHLLASILAGFGRIEDALPWQTQAVRLAPHNMTCRLRLGDMQLKNNQPALAAKTYTTALTLEPENGYALLGLARCDLASDNWESARDRLLKAVEHQQKFFGGWALLATILDHFDNHAAAAQARLYAKQEGRFRDLSDPWLDDMSSDCYDAYQLSIAAALKTDASEARHQLERAISLAPGNSSYHRQLAKLLSAAHDFPSARQHLETAVAATPSDAESWSALIDVLIALKDGRAAQGALVRGLANCPESAYLHFLDGRRLAATGHLDEAIIAFNTSKQLQPNEARAYVQLSAIYAQQSRFNEAIAETKAALTVEPANANLLILLARLAIITNDEESAGHWLQLLRQSPMSEKEIGDVEGLYHERFGHSSL